MTYELLCSKDKNDEMALDDITSFETHNQKKREEFMVEVVEIIRHTEHLIPVLRVELLSYLSLVSLVILLGMVNVFVRRG